MTKYHGFIGYAKYVETALDTTQEEIEEREAVGEVLKNTQRWENGEHLNDNLTISNRISIVADPYTYANSHLIRYCTFMGSKWKVQNIEFQYPNLILTLGGVYNDQNATK